MMTKPARTRRKKSNVLSLRGAAPPVPQIVPSVVEKLEELLARARDGHLVGFAFACLSPQGHGHFGWAGIAERDLMIANVARLQHDMMATDREANGG